MADYGSAFLTPELVSDGVVGHEDAAGHDGRGQGTGGVWGGGEPCSRLEAMEAKVLFRASPGCGAHSGCSILYRITGTKYGVPCTPAIQ